MVRLTLSVNGQERLLLGVAATFVFLNSFALALLQSWSWRTWLAPLTWFLAMSAAHLVFSRYAPRRDPVILPIVALLTGWGIILIARLAINFLGRQVIWLLLATAALVVLALLPRNLRWLRRYRYSWLTLGLLLLGATLLFGVNPSGAGAALWLPIPFVGRVFFQPSELLKLLLIVFLASYFDEREPLLRGARRILPYVAPLALMWGFSMLLLVWQRDLGTATLFFLLFLALLYLATGSGWYVAGGVFLLLVAGVVGYVAFDVVALRVDAWWNPWPDAGDRAFQIVQALYAVAAGGVLGQGVGQGFPTYIPVVHSDFAFGAIAEEWGIIGALVVLACFLLLAHRGFRMAQRARRPFTAYLAVGIVVILCAQAFLIMGGVTRLLPLTGVTLPFVSYGGSSLLMSGIMAGLLLNVSTRHA